jgi:hypothetical protein
MPHRKMPSAATLGSSNPPFDQLEYSTLCRIAPLDLRITTLLQTPRSEKEKLFGSMGQRIVIGYKLDKWLSITRLWGEAVQ